MSIDVRAAWESALDELERTLETTRRVLSGEVEGTTYDVPAWTPPTVKGSMPADLMPRAQELLDRQQDLIKEIHGANPNLRGAVAKFSKEQAKKLKEMSFDANALAARKLPYERLDQLVTELLLGVL